ncbi:C1 family peptidase [Bacillus thuringiensis]|uniref:C1 family peptidase n=1 Tax=Bacillus thuringiensis TaxID=1428 RepID=UPI000F8A1175|nr:C1 family peptidase [Bacillus thuringiensis]AZR80531.1 peptidase C1 [Bacillus thuringiensis]AZR80606.1 peptidase C1 [Bacillus thuringiensis]
MKDNTFTFFMMTLVGIIGFLFVPVVHAETEKSFQPNDFSTYGLGLKDTKINEAIPDYTPSISYLTKQEATKHKQQGIQNPNILPNRIDLREYFPEVRSQGKFGTCVPFATTALREYYIAKDAGARGTDITYLSPSYIYYPSGPKDGMYFESAFQILKQEGVPPETERLYDLNPENTNQFKEPLTALQQKNAVPYKISSYQAIRQANMIADIKQAVANQDPVLVGIHVYPNFDATPTSGIVPPVTEKKSRGGHALVIVGYDETNQWFIVRNSWGIKFGDQGYAYMHYQTLLDMSNSVAYVIKPIHKKYPPFGVQMQTTDISPSEIKFNISAKNATAYDLYKNNQKIQTFSTSTITDLKIVPEQSYMYHVVAKNAMGETRSYPLSISIPPIISIQQAS